MGRSVSDVLTANGIGGVEDADSLEHYGVKGMKWGKRRAAKKEAAAEAESTRQKVKNMSDDELRSAINRIKMEKEFAALTTKQVNVGQKVVGNILLDVGKTLAKEYVTAQANKRIYGHMGGLKAAAAAAEAAAKK